MPASKRLRRLQGTCQIGCGNKWKAQWIDPNPGLGGRFRALTIVDVFTRESLAIEVGQALKGTNVVKVLNRIGLERRTTQDVALRQRFGVHQPDHGPVGISIQGADPFLTAGEANRQRLREIVQRDLARRGLGHALVRTLTEAKESIEA
jgi:hypothetical protein